MPTTAWVEMARPPSVKTVQQAPRLPLARLKLSEAEPVEPRGHAGDGHVGDVGRAMVPEPLATVQAGRGVGRHGHVVGGARGQRGGEGEGRRWRWG